LYSIAVIEAFILFAETLWKFWWICSTAWDRYNGLHSFCIVIYLWKSGKTSRFNWVTGNFIYMGCP